MKRKTLSRFNGFDNEPKRLKRLTSVRGRNTGLKAGVNENVGNYMTMARELNCGIFAAA